MRSVSRAFWPAGLALVLALPLSAAAQVSFGVTGGASLATLTGDDARGDLSRRTGFNVGAFAEFPLADIVWLQPGVSYVQKGAKFDAAAIDHVAIDYIEVPLLLRVALTTRQPLGVHVLLGPTLGFQMRCDVKLPSATRSCDEQAASDLDLTKSFDLGAAFGGGISYGMSPGMALMVNALWDLGLLSIDDSPASRDVKNEAILLNLGLAFRR